MSGALTATAATEQVQRHIIEPMRALYPPPHHLRADATSLEHALAQYLRALDRFDGPTLAAGWAKVTAEHQYWVWPSPGVVAEACRRCSPPPPAVSEGERRRQEATAMTEAYVQRYMTTTQMARLAREGGWTGSLRAFVHEAAWVQAQLICGVPRIGFATCLIPAEPPSRSAASAFEDYRATIRAAVESGRIRVTVPSERVRQWRASESTVRAAAAPESPGR